MTLGWELEAVWSRSYSRVTPDGCPGLGSTGRELVFNCETRANPGLPFPETRIPGHALHEKGLQKQIGSVGTLVSSQERRAPVVPRIQQSVRQALALFPHRFQQDFGLWAVWGERMKAAGGALSTRPSPPTLSPHPTLPLASGVSSFRSNVSWRISHLPFLPREFQVFGQMFL